MERRTIPVRLTQRSAIEWDLPDKISSWPRLLRVTAYCLLFFYKIRRRLEQTDNVRLDTVTDLSGAIKRARNFWIANVQGFNFPGEIQAIRRGDGPSKSSPLRNLNPFLNSKNILRMGGCLCQASLSYDEKYPIILPRHRISDLIVAQVHHRTLHGETQLTLGV